MTRAAIGMLALCSLAWSTGGAAQAELSGERAPEATAAASASPDATPPGAPTSGPDAATLEEAQSLFRRGLELGEQGRWADALEHFRRSCARVERPSTLFNIGMALVHLGRFVEAIEVLDEVLGAPERLPEAARLEAERLRSEASASLGEVTLSLSPPDAVLYVDGVERTGLGASRVVPLDPGRHVLRATAPEHDEAALTVSVVAGEHGAHDLVLVPHLAVVPDPLPVPAPASGGDVLSEPWFWIVGGVIVVGIGVGVGVGVGVGNAAPPSYGGTTGVVLLAP